MSELPTLPTQTRLVGETPTRKPSYQDPPFRPSDPTLPLRVPVITQGVRVVLGNRGYLGEDTFVFYDLTLDLHVRPF